MYSPQGDEFSVEHYVNKKAVLRQIPFNVGTLFFPFCLCQGTVSICISINKKHVTGHVVKGPDNVDGFECLAGEVQAQGAVYEDMRMSRSYARCGESAEDK